MLAESEFIGFLASGLVLATFAMKDMRRLRLTAILSNVAFIAYGLVCGLLPVLALHILLLPLNILRLRDERRAAPAIASEGFGRRCHRRTWGMASAASIAIAAGLAGLWLLHDPSQVMRHSVPAQVEIELAVSDTPFDPAIDALSRRNALSKATRAAGYRGSDFVHWP